MSTKVKVDDANVIIEMRIGDLTKMILHTAKIAYTAGKMNTSVDDTLKTIMEEVSEGIHVVNATIHRKH